MYRQTLDDKYAAAIGSDLSRVASGLNYFAAEVNTPEQIQRYAQKRLKRYQHSDDERTQRRFAATQTMPEYLYLGIDLLGSMARANEYGCNIRKTPSCAKFYVGMTSHPTPQTER